MQNNMWFGVMRGYRQINLKEIKLVEKLWILRLF